MLNLKQRLEDWFKIKFNIHEKISETFFREGQIWLCLIGQNVGFEQNGNKNFIRPVLILKKTSKNTAIILPLTSKRKDIKSRKKISFHTKNTTESFVLFDQIKVIDSKRFKQKIGKISKNELNEIAQDFNLFLSGKIT